MLLISMVVDAIHWSMLHALHCTRLLDKVRQSNLLNEHHSENGSHQGMKTLESLSSNQSLSLLTQEGHKHQILLTLDDLKFQDLPSWKHQSYMNPFMNHPDCRPNAFHVKDETRVKPTLRPSHHLLLKQTSVNYQDIVRHVDVIYPCLLSPQNMTTSSYEELSYPSFIKRKTYIRLMK